MVALQKSDFQISASSFPLIPAWLVHKALRLQWGRHAAGSYKNMPPFRHPPTPSPLLAFSMKSLGSPRQKSISPHPRLCWLREHSYPKNCSKIMGFRFSPVQTGWWKWTSIFPQQHSLPLPGNATLNVWGQTANEWMNWPNREGESQKSDGVTSMTRVLPSIEDRFWIRLNIRDMKYSECAYVTYQYPMDFLI